MLSGQNRYNSAGAKMPQRSIRFGVRNNESLHSATWKLWTETSGGHSEVYLACRALGGELKASMHQSGNWHVAFSQNTFEEKVEGAVPSLDSRFVDKWPRPPEIADGVTLAFKIVTPETAVSSNSEVKNPSKIVWAPAPPDGKASKIYICITTPSAKISEWPGKDSMGTSLIGSFHLNNGDTVWAVSQIVDCPDFSKFGTRTGYFFNGKSRGDLRESDNLRALLFGDNPDGSRVIYDVAGKTGTS
jgi:hypothetical protein